MSKISENWVRTSLLTQQLKVFATNFISGTHTVEVENLASKLSSDLSTVGYGVCAHTQRHMHLSKGKKKSEIFLHVKA